MTKEDIKERAKDISYMIKTPGWTEWLEPHLKEMIEKNNKLSSINITSSDEEVAVQIRNIRARHDMYQGLLNKIKAWLKMEDTRG